MYASETYMFCILGNPKSEKGEKQLLVIDLITFNLICSQYNIKSNKYYYKLSLFIQTFIHNLETNRPFRSPVHSMFNNKNTHDFIYF